MKFMDFKHKDVYVKVHTPLIVTKRDEEKKETQLVYANIIDIDSRVQAMFAQFHHAKKANDVVLWIRHAPRIGEKEYDKSSFAIRPSGKYRHLSQREDDTFVTGIVANEMVLSRQNDVYMIFAWDGDILQKLFFAIDAYYESPMLEEWTPYLFNQLLKDKYLIPLTVHDFVGDYADLVAYELTAGEDVLDGYISYGLRTGAIQLTEDCDITKEAI
ncbi:hypothetical protein [Paenibacillus sp. Soil787]|uniref:hypothetical protein n=1 Tax=Paenibacillus sp. Soil787 TaxID=1736411 RepID=UPI0006F259DB|nr:hypothetical protein [Paenibacillus sp. Soil787]KRF31677.1 hypothetical protein ASG93_04885 [Paenibacillus sp. Soil787]